MTKKPKWRSILFLSLALLAASLIMACGEPTSPPWPTIAAGTSIFSFNAQQGGPNPSNQTLSVWNAGDGTLSWSASDNADWLILSPTNGSSTGEIDNITISVDVAGMNSGSYGAVVTISDPNATNASQTMVVILTINPLAEEEENVIAALDTNRLLDIGYNRPEDVVTVEGVIVRTYYAKSSKGEPTFLDFHDPYEGYFNCIIWKEDRQTHEPIRDKFIKAFPPNPETYFLNKKVRVKGSIHVYQGDPEIMLHDPSQIWTVE